MDLDLLIELVRGHTELYDPNHPKYSDMKLKNRSWIDIGRELNQTGAACKKLWVSLRDSYRRAIRNRRHSTGGQQGVIRRWRYEKEMSFLLPFFQERPTVPILGDSEKDEEDTSFNEPIISSPCLDVHLGDHENDRETVSSEQRPMITIKKRKAEKMEESATSAVIKYLLEKSNASKADDPLSSFFYAICATVKTFPPYHQHLAKARIFQVVSDLELSLVQGCSAPTDIQSTSRSISAEFQEESKCMDHECSDPLL